MGINRSGLLIITIEMTPTNMEPEALMATALEEASSAAERGEVPVGAAIWANGQIIARASNRTEELNDPSAHAEVLAIREATSKIGNWRLNESVLCVTLEPCTMCLGTIRLARIPTLIFGAFDPRLGAVGSLYDLSLDPRLGNPVPKVISGVKEADCSNLLKDFFSRLREK